MEKRYYSAPGLKGIKAFQFIAQLLKDPDLDLNQPMVDSYLFEVGYELGWELEETNEIIKFIKLRDMLV
jgi:hypothetical protein